MDCKRGVFVFGNGKMSKEIKEVLLEKKIPIATSLDASFAAIDFSHPDKFISNLDLSIKHSIPHVCGTTGVSHLLEKAKELVSQSNISFIHAANFSMGVFLFRKILIYSASLIKGLSLYDVAGHESHHNKKIDAPSGTALDIKKQLEEIIGDFVPFSSLRCGNIPGTHQVVFDSNYDTLEFTHRARSKKGFAEGAVLAANWLRDKKGFFTIEDLATCYFKE